MRTAVVFMLLFVIAAAAIQAANAATMRSVVGQGSGTATLPWCQPSFSDFTVMGFHATKEGKNVNGSMFYGTPPVFGFIDDGNIADGKHFRLTGVAGGCGHLAFDVAFAVSGACGTNTVISYTDELGGTGTFTGNVDCTLT